MRFIGLFRDLSTCLLGLLLAFSSLAETVRRQPDFSVAGSLTVKILEFPALTDSVRKRKVPIKVFYPAETGKYPLIIMSHGAGGNWDANFFQSRHLTSHGYVIFAVEHVGSNTQVLLRSLRLRKNLQIMTHDANELFGRPKDIKFALDKAAEWNRTSAELRDRIDLENIGIMGHSYGAYTTLVVGGMRPALNWVNPADLRREGLGPDLSDSRIKCGVALSPQGPCEPFFIKESYSSLKIPLLGVSGSKDRQMNAEPGNRRKAFELWPPGDKYLIWLANADHSAFSDSTGSGRRNLPSPSRKDAQPLVRAAVLLFFNAYLKGDAAAKKALNAEGLKPYLRGVVDAVEVLRK